MPIYRGHYIFLQKLIYLFRQVQAYLVQLLFDLLRLTDVAFFFFQIDGKTLHQQKWLH